MLQDTGFEGLQIDVFETEQPTKKTKCKELTAVEKQRNQNISQERMTIMRIIGGVKIFRIINSMVR